MQWHAERPGQPAWDADGTVPAERASARSLTAHRGLPIRAESHSNRNVRCTFRVRPFPVTWATQTAEPRKSDAELLTRAIEHDSAAELVSSTFPGHPTTTRTKWIPLASPHALKTHRIARVFTQLLLFRGQIHEFLEARRAEGRALLLVRHRQLGAPVRRQLRFAPRGSAGCTERMQRRLPAGAGAGNRVALVSLVSSKGPRGRTAQIRLRRRDHAVQIFLFSLKYPQSRLLFAGLRDPGGTSALQSQFRTEQGLGFLLEIRPHPPLAGHRRLPLGAAMMLGWLLLHGARAAAGQPKHTGGCHSWAARAPGATSTERALQKYAQCSDRAAGGVCVWGGGGGGGGFFSAKFLKSPPSV